MKEQHIPLNDSLDKKDVLEKRQYTDQDQPVHA